jgi:hypothetical protein
MPKTPSQRFMSGADSQLVGLRSQFSTHDAIAGDNRGGPPCKGGIGAMPACANDAGTASTDVVYQRTPGRGAGR